MSAGLREVKGPGPSYGPVGGLLRRLAPGLAARRARAELELERVRVQRGLLEEFEHALRAGYAGASKAVGYSEWNPGAGSPDEDILDDLPMLRSRSRDLIRNDPHAAGLVDTWVHNIVGGGLVPQSRVDREALGLTDTQAEAFESAAEKVWERWARRADVTGRLSAEELQALILRQVFESGDVFAIPRPIGKGRYKLAVQVVEADRVMTPQARISDNSIRDGIKVGADGEHVRYFVKRTHPGDTQAKGYRTDDFATVEAEDAAGRKNIHHIYRVLRPDQTRGVPLLAPALLLFHDLRQYFRAELIGAKVAACYSLFITTPDPLGTVQGVAATPRMTGAGGALKQLLQPGTKEYLAPGEQVQSFSPNRPNSAFDAFIQRVLRGIGCAIQTPYELVSMDFSQTTYTSGRMALTEVRRVYRIFQRWLVRQLLQPLWERLLLEAYLMGDLPAPRFEENLEDYTRALWVGPGWAWVDPAKEVAATVESLDNNLTTYAEECAARGQDWEEVFAQRAREKARAEELGLSVQPPAPAMGGEGPGDGVAEEGGEDGGGADEEDEGGTDGEENDDGENVSQE